MEMIVPPLVRMNLKKFGMKNSFRRSEAFLPASNAISTDQTVPPRPIIETGLQGYILDEHTGTITKAKSHPYSKFARIEYPLSISESFTQAGNAVGFVE